MPVTVGHTVSVLQPHLVAAGWETAIVAKKDFEFEVCANRDEARRLTEAFPRELPLPGRF
jgi:hypothetical protein